MYTLFSRLILVWRNVNIQLVTTFEYVFMQFTVIIWDKLIKFLRIKVFYSCLIVNIIVSQINIQVSTRSVCNRDDIMINKTNNFKINHVQENYLIWKNISNEINLFISKFSYL